MFNFLKKLFKETKVSEDVNIELSDIASWFEAESKKLIESTNKEIEPILDELKAKIKETEDKVEALKNAELSNPKISEREKQFMEGNRTAYMKAVKNFLNEILLVNDIKMLYEYYKEFDVKLNSFAKSTGRSYYILQEFFGTESSKIASNINNINKSISRIKELIGQRNIGSLDLVKLLIMKLKNKEEIRKKLEDSLERNESIKEDAGRRLNKLKEENNEIENSDDKKNLTKLLDDKINAVNEKKELEREYLYQISFLRKAISKYARIMIGEIKILNKYATSPIEAVFFDKDLRVIEILKSMSNNIRNNQIAFDEKKKEKVLAVLSKLNRNYFDNFLVNEKRLKSKLKDIEQEIMGNKAYRGQGLINEEQKEIIVKLDKVKKDTNQIKEEIEKIDIQKIKDELKDRIFKILQVRINI